MEVKMKKIVLIFCLMYVSEVYADIVASGNNCGANCSWEIDDKGKMRVYGTGNMYTYKHTTDANEYGDHYSNRPWWPYQALVTEIEIEDGITSVGGNAFINFQNLQNAKISDDVTRIFGGAFQSCKNLSSVRMPQYLTYIGGQAFENTNLTEIELSDTLQRILNNAFGDTEISDLVLPGSVSELDSTAFISKGGKQTNLATLYCTAEQKDKCLSAIEGSKLNIDVTLYEKTGEGLMVYDKQGNIVGKYTNAETLSKGIPVETYTYDNAGHMVGKFDSHGQRIWGKKIYTVEEAMEATKNGDKFHVRLTYK